MRHFLFVLISGIIIVFLNGITFSFNIAHAQENQKSTISDQNEVERVIKALQKKIEEIETKYLYDKD